MSLFGSIWLLKLIWVGTPETLLHMNCKGAEQPAFLCSLISAFVIDFLESLISKLASCQISILKLDSKAEHFGLNLTLLYAQKTGFLTLRHI